MPHIHSPRLQPTKVQAQRLDPSIRRTQVARILLVEDEPVTGEVFARVLQQDGFAVHAVRDGMQALHALRDAPPDLMVLDLGLPTLSGIEVLRQLRSGPLAAMPVVVISGASPRSLRAGTELLQPGVWLEKPVRPRELIAAVHALRGA
jgi:DNA-binding response OmpR family regulator